MDILNPLLTLAITFNTVGGVIIGLLGFIVAFGLAVFIHELGHFLAAKAFKVPVERFVIGFDKEAMPFLPGCIWEKQIGETVYGLSLVPLGGYVKMSGVVHPEIEKYLEGEEKPKEGRTNAEVRPDGAAAPSGPDKNTLQGQAMQDMAALYKKPFWQKTIIYSAGVIMNLLLAMVVVAFLFAKGHEVGAPLAPVVGWMPEDSSFAQTPLQTGDRVVSVNGQPVETYNDFMTVLLDPLDEDASVEELQQLSAQLVLERPGGGTYEYALSFSSVLEEGEGDRPTLTKDFAELLPKSPAYVDFVLPNDPADKAGIQHGDIILSVNGETVQDWTHFRYLVMPAARQELEMVLQRGEEQVTVTVVPTENPDRPGTGLVGLMPGNPQKELRREPVLTAVAAAPARTWNMVTRYVGRLGELGGKAISGNVASVQRELSGPAGIAQFAYRQAQRGFDDWLNFLILLNVALAVMNILPFPVLDGGHICFAMYEAVFRRPVPPKILVPLLNSAVIFILVFFVLVTFNDLFKIFI